MGVKCLQLFHIVHNDRFDLPGCRCFHIAHWQTGNFTEQLFTGFPQCLVGYLVRDFCAGSKQQMFQNDCCGNQAHILKKILCPFIQKTGHNTPNAQIGQDAAQNRQDATDYCAKQTTLIFLIN